MTIKEHAIMNWSGGKDSAMALYTVLQDNHFIIDYLLTNITKPFQRVSMHGIRESLLDKQAESIKIPLHKVYLSEQSSMEEYEQEMKSTLTSLNQKGITQSIFGDIFLEDLREYRDTQLAKTSITGVYPLWKKNTAEIASDFIQTGFQSIVVCVDERFLNKSFVGRLYNASFLNDLPEGVDPCGENGEFHTFVFDGPMFKKPIPFRTGGINYRKYENSTFQTGFWYLDLLNAR